MEDQLSVARKRKWMPWEKGDVPCEICGLLCPLECYPNSATVHLTCRYTTQGAAWTRAQKKIKKEEFLAENGLGL
jgi:hypothetical protein